MVCPYIPLHILLNMLIKRYVTSCFGSKDLIISFLKMLPQLRIEQKEIYLELFDKFHSILAYCFKRAND
jgi:hypothetical protein